MCEWGKGELEGEGRGGDSQPAFAENNIKTGIRFDASARVHTNTEKRKQNAQNILIVSRRFVLRRSCFHGEIRFVMLALALRFYPFRES